MAQDIGKKAKSASKKNKPEKRNWVKIAIPLLLVVIMLGSIVAYVFSGSKPNLSSDSGQATDITKPFNNITDALHIVSANASYVRYADMKDDSKLKSWMSQYFTNTIPPSKFFNANPQRDVIAVYPKDNFGNFSQYGYNYPYNSQWMSLTDFGGQTLNQSYDAYIVNGEMALAVNSNYFFTPNTKPVISGMPMTIASTLDVIRGNNSSAYGQYSDVLQQIKYQQFSESGMTLETVGKQCSANFTDMYYAAMGPNKGSKNSTYHYIAIMRLNQTLTNDEMAQIALLESAEKKAGFENYTLVPYEKYAVIDANGSFDLVSQDMYYRWGFLKN